MSRSSPSSLIVSAGFDAHVDDPLAGMAVTADGFRDLAARCTQLAPQVAAVLEGGYNLGLFPVSSRPRWRASRRRAPRGVPARTKKRPGCGPAVLIAVPPRELLKEPAYGSIGVAATHRNRPALTNGIPPCEGSCWVPRQRLAAARRSSASRRDDTPSLRSKLFTCERTVCSEM